MIGWIIVGVGVVVVLLVLWAVGVYNGLIKLRNLGVTDRTAAVTAAYRAGPPDPRPVQRTTERSRS